ncbi:MAG: hypothetical protein AAFP26_07535, partial [Planctomycetota bacterium]
TMPPGALELRAAVTTGDVRSVTAFVRKNPELLDVGSAAWCERVGWPYSRFGPGLPPAIDLFAVAIRGCQPEALVTLAQLAVEDQGLRLRERNESRKVLADYLALIDCDEIGVVALELYSN